MLYAVNAKRVSVLKSVPCGERTWRALSGSSALRVLLSAQCSEFLESERGNASALKVGCVHGRRVGGMR